MPPPETARQFQRRIRHGDETILIALGVADMKAPARGVDIALLQAQAFAEIQLQAVDGEIKDVVTEEGMGALDIRLA